jgi:hypothetical protein
VLVELRVAQKVDQREFSSVFLTVENSVDESAGDLVAK